MERPSLDVNATHNDDIQPFDDDERKAVELETPPQADPFGDEVMIAQNIPLATLGIVPSMILILGLSGMSWYTAIIIGQFKARNPQVHSMADAGEILLCRFGRELLGLGQLFLLIFIVASHILTFSVLMNELTNHGACTIVFGVVGLVISFIGALPRTMEKVYWISLSSFASIFIATLVTMTTIAVQRSGPAQIDIVTSIHFSKAFLAVTNIVFAYIAHVAFFGYISEIENLRDYPKALAMLQITDTCMYIVAAVVICVYAGPGVSSPALSSAGPLMKKIAYGLAIPTVIFSGVVVGHVACKYIYVRIFRGSPHMHNRGLISVGSWVAIVLVIWVVAWVIAESIPVFNDLLSLISSLFGS
ncbi:uncharacterized protein KD926_003662 [Aspergillus affinis]|uniref:uncharacterized protein n=1 Tax=Aspergillus affinis TaxID=1070780 RepID=UPI0022FDE1C7|nr:uncharacterized protein KD926_003662 [Aspergillus affinis]KAI9043511.1 hypothetical protein KD926_003662 [Aspergillus affinis]